MTDEWLCIMLIKMDVTIIMGRNWGKKWCAEKEGQSNAVRKHQRVRRQRTTEKNIANRLNSALLIKTCE